MISIYVTNLLIFSFTFFFLKAKIRNWPCGGKMGKFKSLGRLSMDVGAIWNFSTTNMVGILVGYYGASHIFCHVRYCDGLLRLFPSNKTSKFINFISSKSPGELKGKNKNINIYHTQLFHNQQTNVLIDSTFVSIKINFIFFL